MKTPDPYTHMVRYAGHPLHRQCYCSEEDACANIAEECSWGGWVTTEPFSVPAVDGNPGETTRAVGVYPTQEALDADHYRIGVPQVVELLQPRTRP